MTLAILDPSSTVSNNGTVTGAPSAHQALWGTVGDTSYIDFAPGQEATVGLADLSLPGGAVLRWARIDLKLATIGGPGTLGAFLGGIAGERAAWVSWVTPTTIAMTPTYTDVTDPLLDAATLTIFVGGGGPLRVYDAYVSLSYVMQPTVNVTAPTGTVTDSPTPTVHWTHSLDTEGGGQTHAHIKVFTAAQYGAGGFDPATSTATIDSGVIQPTGSHMAVGSATQWRIPTNLADGTYRTYVRIAQTVDGLQHWSTWDFEGFTLNVLRPAPPTITATAQSTSGRIAVHPIAGGTGGGAFATTDAGLEVQRSTDAGVTWVPVRTIYGDNGILDSIGEIIYDYEAPNGVSTLYRARGLHRYGTELAAGAWTVSSAATWSSSQWWLKDPLRPAQNVPIELVAYGEVTFGARNGVVQPIGAVLPLVVADTRLGAAGASIVQTRTTQQRNTLETAAAQVATLLLQGPVAAGEPDRYIRVGDLTMARLVENINIAVRRFTLPWHQTALPAGAQTGAQYA